MKAAILAAGTATRLRPYTDTSPKTLLEVGGTPILRRLIGNLRRAGVEQLVIGTGYLEHMIRDAVGGWFPDLDVTYVTNADYTTTNNAYSLLLMREQLDGHPFLLLDGDVVFDAEIVERLLRRGGDCMAVRTRGELGAEEMKVTADADGRIVQISKLLPPTGVMGESMSIELFSEGTSRHLFATLNERVRVHGHVGEYYEHSIQQILDEGAEIYGVDIGALHAVEIDTPEDLLAVNQWFAQAVPARSADRVAAAAE